MAKLRGLKGLIGKATDNNKAGYLVLALSTVNAILGVSTKPSTVAKSNAKPRTTAPKHSAEQLLALITKNAKICQFFKQTPKEFATEIEAKEKETAKYQRALDKLNGVDGDDTRDKAKLKQIKQAIENVIANIEALGKDDKSWVENSLREKSA